MSHTHRKRRPKIGLAERINKSAEERGARNALAAVQAIVAGMHREQCEQLREYYDTLSNPMPLVSLAGSVRLRIRGRLLEELSREVERLAAGAGGTGLEVTDRIDHIVRDRMRSARAAGGAR